MWRAMTSNGYCGISAVSCGIVVGTLTEKESPGELAI